MKMPPRGRPILRNLFASKRLIRTHAERLPSLSDVAACDSTSGTSGSNFGNLSRILYGLGRGAPLTRVGGKLCTPPQVVFCFPRRSIRKLARCD
jgi:hypothetical protein